MNLGIVTPRYPPNVIGGGELSAQLLATQMSQTDRISDVTVYSFDGDGIERQGDVRVVRLGSLPRPSELANVYAYAKLRSRVANRDVLHAYNMALHPAVGALSNRRDIPTVATLNSYKYLSEPVDGLEFSAAQRVRRHTTLGPARRTVEQIDRFIGLSEALIDIYDDHGFPSEKLVHVPNMLDPALDPSEDREGIDGFELLYVGALRRHKGVDHLVRAVSELPERFTLRLVGTGPEEENLRAIATETGVADRVEFTGFVPHEEICGVYGRADAFVHPGIWPEPFPRTMLEAMDAGLPVAVTDIGAPPDVIPDEEFVAKPADSGELAAAIERVSERPREVGERNRRIVRDRYVPEVVVPQLLDVYDDAIAVTA